jgi:NTE family protein
MLEHWAAGGAAVEEVIRRGDRLIARNILDGRSATFDLQGNDAIKEKQA